MSGVIAGTAFFAATKSILAYFAKSACWNAQALPSQLAEMPKYPCLLCQRSLLVLQNAPAREDYPIFKRGLSSPPYRIILFWISDEPLSFASHRPFQFSRLHTFTLLQPVVFEWNAVKDTSFTDASQCFLYLFVVKGSCCTHSFTECTISPFFCTILAGLR